MEEDEVILHVDKRRSRTRLHVARTYSGVLCVVLFIMLALIVVGHTT